MENYQRYQTIIDYYEFIGEYEHRDDFIKEYQQSNSHISIIKIHERLQMNGLTLEDFSKQ